MVQNIQSHLHNKFMGEPKWFSHFNNDNNEIKIFLEEVLIEIIKNISISILSGEYIKDSTKFKEDVSSILKFTNQIYEDVIFEEDADLANAVEYFTGFIEDIFNTYINVEKQIELHTKNPTVEVVFSKRTIALSDKLLESFNFFDQHIRLNADWIAVLLQLTILDHFFEESIQYFQRLLELEDRIGQNEIEIPYIGALNDKVLFLKYKWLVRQISNQAANVSHAQRIYIVDNSIFSFSDTPHFALTNEKLKSWKEHLDNHYEYNNSKEYYIQNILPIEEKQNYTFLDIHFLIRYYKDINPNYENLKEVVEVLSKRKDEFPNDKQTFYKNYNYALNNQFSLLIEKDNVCDIEVNSLKQKIDSLQNKIGYNNFFVDYKFLKYNLSQLRKIVDDRQPLEFNSNLIKIRIDLIRALIQDCEKKIDWSENHHNLLYQLPYEESLVPYNTAEINDVYYASSFLLPLSVQQAYHDFNELKRDYQNNFNNVEIFATLEKEFNVVKELYDKNKDSDKKSIETLTIFSAVIAFLVGTIQGFKFVDTLPNALIFTTVFSLSLSSFVLLIFSSTKGVQKMKEFWIYIVGFYVLGLIFLLSLFYWKGKVDGIQNENYKLKNQLEINKGNSVNKKALPTLKKEKKLTLPKQSKST
ncbi:hypothetical protein [Chryseobacterium sp. MP_3.2]|uniref:hypothetical protein n=1 Tax=Chryseobacterium sp. MP_3.2 TaxID=3071712 RepID=UPI002DFD8FBA|nr:hypothetical protein [Chryseobacterium sp. MP_3.2]